MNRVAGVLFLVASMLTGAAVGCASSSAPAKSVSTASTQALARGALETVEHVWMDAAQGCVDAAAAGGGDTLLKKCESVMVPARDSLVAAATSLDAWTDASKGEVACFLSDAMASVVQVSTLLGPTAKEQALINDAIELAKDMGCQRPDGGK